ncbi:MAG: hypothetical protein Q9215_006792, partial [Flavoplaca cf. flavocitrina]
MPTSQLLKQNLLCHAFTILCSLTPVFLAQCLSHRLNLAPLHQLILPTLSQHHHRRFTHLHPIRNHPNNISFLPIPIRLSPKSPVRKVLINRAVIQMRVSESCEIVYAPYTNYSCNLVHQSLHIVSVGVITIAQLQCQCKSY